MPHQQTFKRQPIVTPLAEPMRDGSIFINRNPATQMLTNELVRIPQHPFRHDKTLTTRPGKAQRPVIKHPDTYSTLMHLAMMESAQHHQVRKLRLAAVNPVLDMVAVEESRVSAARKTAPRVTRAQRSPGLQAE